MDRSKLIWLLGLLAAALVFVTRSPSAELDTALPVESPAGPVVVELFTSEGCSSCPPADRLFGRLEGDVVQLAFHVDYWNHLGWQDPFSDARWSQRQRRYGDVFDRGYVYTPQIVVGGRAEAVGSDRREVLSMLRADAERPRLARLDLEVAPDTASGALTVAVRGQLSVDAERPAMLLVAVAESGFEVAVDSGENAHRTLEHQHVVRDLLELERVSPGSRIDASVEMPVDGDWRRDRLEVVVLVQDPVSLEILGAGRRSVAATAPDGP